MKKAKSGKGWTADVQPGGRGSKRFRKTFKTQAEAKQWESWVKTQAAQSVGWQPERRDLRRLSDLVELWFVHHGQSLRAGPGIRRKLMAMVVEMGNPPADRFTADQFAKYRSDRLEKGTSANTTNREHSYLRAVINELIRLGHWTKENPLAKVRQIKIQQTEMKYLTDEEIKRLLESLKVSTNPHVELVSWICLATGARWSEAEELRITQIKKGMIEFTQTKSKKNRAVAIEESIEAKIRAHTKKYEVGANGRIFGPAFGAFRKAVEHAGLELPKGQLTHVMRHTFASHFMMKNGNILLLQKVLGHASLMMTMRYAHLSPEHMQEVKRLNPLSGLTLG